MWIRSRIRFTAGLPNASPPGYQSPAPGDSVPVPGSLDQPGAYPNHGSAPQTLLNTPRLFTTAILHSRLRQEDSDNHSVSQKDTALIMKEAMNTPSLVNDIFNESAEG